MHAVGIGIDLTAFPLVVFAELYYSPEKMVQALGRFNRLSGTQPVTAYLMILANTIEETIAQQLEIKLSTINGLIRSGSSENKLAGALTQDDPNWIDKLTLATETMY